MNIVQYEDLASEPGIERLYFEFAITGGAGAVGAINKQRGLNKTTPFVRNSAGNYTINLIEGTFEIVDCNIQVQVAAPTTVATAVRTMVVSRTPGGATPNVVIQCVRTDTSAAADPAASDVVFGFIAIKNTNA